MNLNQVLERAKDIQYSSKTRFNTKRVKELRELHDVLGRLLARLPPAFRNDRDGRELAKLCDQGDITIAHLINRRFSHSAQSKDYEFSRTTVNELWDAGLEDVRRSITKVDLHATEGLRRRHARLRSHPLTGTCRKESLK